MWQCFLSFSLGLSSLNLWKSLVTLTFWPFLVIFPPPIIILQTLIQKFIISLILSCPACYGPCSVFFWVMVSPVEPQEGTQERHKKAKFITLTGPREGGIACHTESQGMYQVWVRWHNTGEVLKPCFYWCFSRKGKAGQVKQFRADWFEWFQWTLSYRGGLQLPITWLWDD